MKQFKPVHALIVLAALGIAANPASALTEQPKQVEYTVN